MVVILILFLAITTANAERLYCLTCTAVVSPRHCHTIHRCDEGQICFTERYTSINGETLFDTGCHSLSICNMTRQTLEDEISHSPDYAHGTRCIECCSSNACNSQGCDSPAYPAIRGPLCFTCSQSNNPEVCRSVRVCDQNEVCHIHEENEFGDTYYVTSCAQQSACKNSIPEVFGKRLVNKCNHCCNSDLCNNICELKPFDCWEVYMNGMIRTGKYTIYPWTDKSKSLQVVCNMDISPKGWTVIQNRGVDKSISFNRTFDEYKDGFGNIDSDFWIGNEAIYALTTAHRNSLHIQFGSTHGMSYFESYGHFAIGSLKQRYNLTLELPVSGTAGDPFLNTDGTVSSSAFDAYHYGRPFTTYELNGCAKQSGGGWWHYDCDLVFLNGPFQKKLAVNVWYGKIGQTNALNYSVMMINSNGI